MNENDQVQDPYKQILETQNFKPIHTIQLSKRITRNEKKLTTQKIIIDAIGDAIEFIYSQKEKGVILGVILKNNELIKEEFEEHINNGMF